MDRKLLIDGKNSLEFNYSWLRDNCQCSQCLHQSTQQKLHSSGQVALMKPIKAEFMDQERIKIFWPKHSLMGSLSEHVSTFSLEWLKRHQSTTTSLNDAVNWTGQMLEPLMKPMEYSRFKTNQGFKDALCNLKKYGIQFLQSVPTANHQQVEEIGKSFGHIQVIIVG